MNKITFFDKIRQNLQSLPLRTVIVMCGRFDCHAEFINIVRSFGASKSSASVIEPDYHPSYNISPSRNVLIVTMQDGDRHLQFAKWGLIPSWAKDPSIGFKMINARAETVSEKPSFKDSFKKHRCLIVADGFFEWRKAGLAKFPVYIRLKSKEPIGFAGLYSHWRAPNGEDICTCAIITTEVNGILSSIHDRMPAIIPIDQYGTWLDPKITEITRLMPLLQPYPSKEMEFYDVTLLVNNPSHDSPDIIEPGNG